MVFPEKAILLNDGRTALLRSPASSDAQDLIRFLKATAGETPFLLKEPEEVTFTPEQEAAFLEAINADPHNVMILCFVDGSLAGSCNLCRKNRQKNRHRAEIGIAIFRKYWGLGIGSALFREMLALAKDWGVSQVELEVIEGNHRAIALYEKMGFATVCAVPNAIRLSDGSMRKEFRMIRTV